MKTNEEILLERQKDFVDSIVKYSKINGGMMGNSLKSELIDALIKALTIINMSGTYIDADEDDEDDE